MKKRIVLLFSKLLFLLLVNSDLSAQQNVSSPDTFVYRQIGVDTLKAYVFKPTISKKTRPAIILFHGGAWRLGEASWMFQRAKEFAEKGIVSICIDYRLANNRLSPIDGVEDACAAFSWVRNHANELGVDSKHVAGYGVSAGGHLVACAAALPSVRGREISDNSRPDAILLYSPALNMASDKYFNALMKGKGIPASYSPYEYINSKLPPTLIIQGEKDSIVLASDAKAFQIAATRTGAKCILFVYPGVGHLLTRNIKVQYKDFDPDPVYAEDAHKREDDFLRSLGYISSK